MIHQLSSPLNFWYLDDVNIGVPIDTVASDFLYIIKTASDLGLEINSAKCELVFLGNLDDDKRKDISSLFNSIYPGATFTSKNDLEGSYRTFCYQHIPNI